MLTVLALGAMAAACGDDSGSESAGPAAPAGDGGSAVGAEIDPDNDAWQELLAEAEGQTLQVVTREHPRYDAIVASFKAAFPSIKVNHTSARPSDIAPRIVSEQSNGVFEWDVTIGSTANMIEVLEPAGTLQDLPPLLVLDDATSDDKWEGGFGLYAGDEEQVLVTAGANFSYIWVNRDEIPADKLGDLTDLADPAFKGAFALGGCERPAQAASAMVMLMHVGGEELVRAVLHDQEPVFFDNARGVAENMLRGRYPIAIGHDANHVAPLAEAGLDAAYEQLLPAAGQGGNLTTEGIAVFRNAPHQAAAQVFLNWFVSQEGQQAFVDASTDAEPWNSRQVEIDILDPTVNPNWADLDQYTSWNMTVGQEQLKQVLQMCAEARS